MKYGILSDIHANLPALTAVLDRLQVEPVDAFLCLGDLVGYGASPNECCDLVRGLKASVVRGNHDLAAVSPGEERWFTPAASFCVVWTREQLSAENRQFLSDLAPDAEVGQAHLCHGSLFDPDCYTTTVREADFTMRLMHLPVCFLGHTHYAEAYVKGDGDRLPAQRPMPQGGVVLLEPGKQVMVNPGAVGQPRDGNSMAAYAVWDTDAAQITLHRVPYNVRAAQENMAAAGLPKSMSARLMLGV